MEPLLEAPAAPLARALRALARRAMLNRAYTFSSLVVGACNQAAVAVSKAVALQPGIRCNPLLVYGSSGVGKTHLLHAVGQEALALQPWLRIARFSSEPLMNRLRSALRSGRVVSLRERLCALDMLILDDLQFVCRDGAATDELLQLYRTLHEQGRQIVLAADRRPEALLHLGAPLGINLAGGMAIQLGPPDLATCVAIAEKKAEIRRIVLPRDVARWLAEQTGTNLRQLEGWLARLEGHALLRGCKITLDLARDVLRLVLGDEQDLKLRRRAQAHAARAPTRREPPDPQPVEPGESAHAAGRVDPATRAGPASIEPPAAQLPELARGLSELKDFIHDVGGDRIEEPEVRGADVYVPMIAADGERYILKIATRDYPRKPPSCGFVNQRFRSSANAWPAPRDGGPFRSPAFICTPPTAEFFAYHRDRVYHHGDGSLVNTVSVIFAALHAPQYGGRFTRQDRDAPPCLMRRLGFR